MTKIYFYLLIGMVRWILLGDKALSHSGPVIIPSNVLHFLILADFLLYHRRNHPLYTHIIVESDFLSPPWWGWKSGSRFFILALIKISRFFSGEKATHRMGPFSSSPPQLLLICLGCSIHRPLPPSSPSQDFSCL